MTVLHFPQRIPVGARPVYIADRPRYAPLTSLRFVAPDRLVCGDFMNRILLLVQLRADGGYDVLYERPSVDLEGHHVSTDLMDFDGVDRIITSNFEPGTQSIYRLVEDRIEFEREIVSDDRPMQCHGVRFVPHDPSLIVATFNAKKDPSLYVIDRETGDTVQRIRLAAQPQDAAFLGPWLLVPARTDHISHNGKAREAIAATMYLFRLPADLRTSAPELVDTWHGAGHLDATAVYGGQVYIANQYLDRVDVFAVTQQGRVVLQRSLAGFDFPHGLDVRADGQLAVTNYGDNSIRLQSLEEAA